MKVASSVAVTWGGEAKDFATLRRASVRHGLRLPPQLSDLDPHAVTRLDLGRATAVQANQVHLPELLAALSIPCTPSPSKDVGRLVEHGHWGKVREQVLADVLATAALAVRHLHSHGAIESALLSLRWRSQQQLPPHSRTAASSRAHSCRRRWGATTKNCPPA